MLFGCGVHNIFSIAAKHPLITIIHYVTVYHICSKANVQIPKLAPKYHIASKKGRVCAPFSVSPMTRFAVTVHLHIPIPICTPNPNPASHPSLCPNYSPGGARPSVITGPKDVEGNTALALDFLDPSIPRDCVLQVHARALGALEIGGAGQCEHSNSSCFTAKYE